MRRVGLGDDHQPGGVLVEPVDDARPLHPADARQRRAAMADQRIDQRAVGMARRGMDDEAGGLVDDDEVLVLEHDVERDVLAPRAAASSAPARRARSLAPASSLRAGSRAARRRRVTSPASISALSRVRDSESPPLGRAPGTGRAVRPHASAPTSNAALARRRHAASRARLRDARPPRLLRAAARPAGPARRRSAPPSGRSPGDARRARGAWRPDAPACCRSSRRRCARPHRPRAGVDPPSAPACRNNGYARHAIAARRRWPWRRRPPPGRFAVMPSTDTRRSAAPTPQLAPKASGGVSKPSNISA